MKASKVQVFKFDNGKSILDLENTSISTSDESYMQNGSNKFYILDENGHNIIHTFEDVRLRWIAKDQMSFIAYTYPKLLKVSIHVWV